MPHTNFRLFEVGQFTDRLAGLTLFSVGGHFWDSGSLSQVQQI